MGESVIVKIGSNVLVPNGRLNIGIINRIAEEICCLMQGGDRFVVVTSGAVRAGKTKTDMIMGKEKEDRVAVDQYLAFKGQPRLMAHYTAAFGRYGIECGQLLLTARNFQDEENLSTVRRVISMALAEGSVPVVNENDPITAEELRNPFTDNDQLASLLSTLIVPNRLIVLSDVPGFLLDTKDSSSVVPVIDDIDQYIPLVDKSAGNGKGGMLSKLNAAKTVTEVGTQMHIVSGTEPGVITAIMDGSKQVGTRFPAKS